MKLSVSFPIKNKVNVRNPFPIAVGPKTYFIAMEGEIAKSVGSSAIAALKHGKQA
jgi:hypothetical protein